MELSEKTVGWGIGTAIGWIVLLFVVLGMWGCPQYNVWQQGLVGEAEFKRAEQNRKIKIEEAKAQNEAATSVALAKIKISEAEAESEIIRARGVAKSNEIIGTSLQGNESYLRYLWINGLSENGNNVIYVPTEANLPLLEAARLTK